MIIREKNFMRLTEIEKKVFKMIFEHKIDELEKSFSTVDIYNACYLLQEKGFIKFVASEQDEVINITQLPRGEVYYKTNPQLEDEIEEKIKMLQKQNLELQNDKLDYEKRIRWQENVIRNKNLLAAVAWIIAFIEGILLLFFNWVKIINFLK